MALDPQQMPRSGAADPRDSSVVAALSVYVEALAGDARVAVLGDGELGFDVRLLELGARTVHLYDFDPERVARLAGDVPRGVSVRVLQGDFDVRDGAFDLVVIPDVGRLPDPSGVVLRLRRIVDPRGAVVAMGRARTNALETAIFPELAPAALEYAELYDLFALQFENVTMTGVLPFRGVVFAELGAGDDLAVSVDTRLAEPEAPGVFVVIASREAAAALDSYAIVQIEREDESQPLQASWSSTREVRLGQAESESEIRAHEAAAAFAAMQLKAEMLASQLDEHRARLAFVDARGAESASRDEAVAREREVALARARARANELESLLASATEALEILERNAVAAEQGMLERDDRIAALEGQRAVEDDDGAVEIIDATQLAEHAEAAARLHAAEFAYIASAHSSETEGLEAQLRERAGVITEMEKELARREQLVRELVASLEEARDGTGDRLTFESAPAIPGVAPEEVVRLRRKLDDLALDVARREGELVAQAWRIAELENDNARLLTSSSSRAERRELRAESRAESDESRVEPRESRAEPAGRPTSELEQALAAARDELDALRQALTQEHAARIAAEPGQAGEEPARGRADLGRHVVLHEPSEDPNPPPEG